MIRTLSRAAIAISIVVSVSEARAAVDYWPTCPAPQRITPVQSQGSADDLTDALVSATAWNGKDFGVVRTHLFANQWEFIRLYADGSVAAPPVPAPVLTGKVHGNIALVWNGSGYGLLWVDAGAVRLLFARLDTNGHMIGEPVVIAGAKGAFEGALAWSGNGYAVLWRDRRNGNDDIYATQLDANGAITNGDVEVAVSTTDESAPSIAWSRAGGYFVVAWQDAGTGTQPTIVAASLAHGQVGVPFTVASGRGHSLTPSLADSGGPIGMAWVDSRDGNDEIYFCLLDYPGQKISADRRLTVQAAGSVDPRAVWTGAEFGVFWRDARNGTGINDVWFQRVDGNGQSVGSNVAVSSFAGAGQHAVAFAYHGFMSLYVSSQNFGTLSAQPWGCSDPVPPACPEAPDAYGVSSTGATITWLPTTDLFTDIAYYEVYRDGALLARTDETHFNDTTFGSSGTHQYNIRTVNAAQFVSSPCPGSQVDVTPSTVSLSVARTGTNVDLTWSDQRSNTYRVMRGTSPQQLTEIARTTQTSASDAVAQRTGTCLYYSIDPPQR